MRELWWTWRNCFVRTFCSLHDLLIPSLLHFSLSLFLIRTFYTHANSFPFSFPYSFQIALWQLGAPCSWAVSIRTAARQSVLAHYLSYYNPYYSSQFFPSLPVAYTVECRTRIPCEWYSWVWYSNFIFVLTWQNTCRECRLKYRTIVTISFHRNFVVV